MLEKLFRWWPLPIVRNYKTSSELTELFLDFLNCPELSVSSESTQYHIIVECSLGKLTFWGENRYYAYGSPGEYIANDGTIFPWKDEMPSRYAIRKMARKINPVVRNLYKDEDSFQYIKGH